ncbi:MAG: MacB family efflux pump subunit [Aeromonadales bacterium]|nr:MacB family efflux pump subunit [Aeromonadales bacterium]MDY2890522.1 MacB family efflux pump subunit [Succinivibrio sp.]
MMEGELLELVDIRRSYGDGPSAVEVLHGITLSIRRGEMVAIIGPSGSGKSTLMNIIGCLDRPTSGSYEVSGRDTSNMEPDELAALRRDFFGFIFQRYLLLSNLNASENVQVPSIYSGYRRDKRAERAGMLLERLGLGERKSYSPSQLSGGQQQRVSIARALMNGGQIILADEPTGALDTKSGEEVMKILTELNSEGHTVILVTHDPRIAAHARRVITIRDGSVVSDKVNEEVSDAASSGAAKSVGAIPDVSLKRAWSTSARAYMDRFSEAGAMALRSMVSNRMRTLLTMLGIIIGIMAVVMVVALARGASDNIISNISSMGTNTISVMPGERMGDVRSGKVRSLKINDMNALRGQPFVDSVSPVVQSSVLFRRDNIENTGTVYGISADYFRVYGMELARGRLFTQSEASGNQQVCVIDAKTASSMFPGVDPIGRKLIVKTTPMLVVGVLTEKDIMFRPRDALYVYAPYSTVMHKMSNQDYLSTLIVRIAAGFSTPVAEASLVSLLKARHGRKDFFIQSSDTIMKTISQTTSTFTLLISAIAVISLLVGGIGVMNIMLVSVTERTREIGIRMAVGARQSDIMTQFLIEAVTVCITGGLAGVLLSLVAGKVVMLFFPSVPLSFSALSIIVAVLTSSAIGMVFGFMPARNAARLDPIEALARE